MSVVEFTREVEYCCPSFITYIVRSKSELLEDGSFTGNRFSVLPSHRCQPTVIEYSSDGELFVFQQEISIILQKSSGESFSSMDITYRASKISFSPNIWPDFYLLMACSYQKGKIQVWSIPKDGDYPEQVIQLGFNLRIASDDDNEVGSIFPIEGVYWVPKNDKRENMPYLFIVLENCVRAIAYSITDRTKIYLPSPVNSKRGIAFHPTAPLLAYLHRPLHTDFILIYSTITWEEIFRFEIETEKAEDLFWHGDSICVCDTYLVYGVYWYDMTGLSPSSFTPTKQQLGIKTLALNENQYLAIGSYDEFLRIIDSNTGKIFAREKLGAIIPDMFSAIVYKEVNIDDIVKYDVQDLPFLIPYEDALFKKGSEFPQSGIGLVKWSSSGRHLAIRNDCMPHALWIWDLVTKTTVAILIHEEKVQNAHWDPQNERLAICTGTNYIFLWNPEGCSCISCSDDLQFQSIDILWNPKSDSLIIMGVCSFIVGFIPS